MEAFWGKLDIDLFILVLFATVGIYRIAELLAMRFLRKQRPLKFSSKKPEIVLVVKDLEDQIEGIIRSLARDGVFERSEAVAVIDQGSKDKTSEILKRLSPKFGFDVEEDLRLDFQKSPFALVVNCNGLNVAEIEAYIDGLLL
ncbi:MAG: hypothetical protein L5655_01970 [Thermosediminibacteraceae bacterium]|nr:hypothetical protein [Thermosediminibacteraceae bacterium]